MWSTNTSSNMTMNTTRDKHQELPSPAFEDLHPSPPTSPALIVHVDISFTNPDLQPRYSRSYGSSPAFAPTARIRNGLLRRIDRCSRELLTRKDSAALDMINDASLERKPLRFEMTFRITTRDGGDWAQRTYRSYQKQPLTVADTKDVILASHRIVGLFLRKHDEGFLWMDGAVRDTDDYGSETTTDVSSPSLLCVPRSRFLESSQSFEFVPGYTVEVFFRSRNSQREVPLFAKTARVNSEQAAPLTVFTSEDVLWRGLQAINQGLERRKQQLDGHIRNCHSSHCQHSDDKSLLIELRVSNNLGPIYPHVHRAVESKLLLFRDADSRDCDEFLRDVETTMADVRRDTDAKMSGLNDFEFTIMELRGSGWSTRRPATFSIGPSASFGRRTIQAALDRIQTGIADVIRGHDVAIHISSHKRGHLVLDKAIVAHAKHESKEPLSLPEEEQATFVSRLKTRIQQDIDLVFEDTCTIDDIADEEVEQRPFSRLAALCSNGSSSKTTISSRSNSVASEAERRPATPIRDSPKKPSPAQRPATPSSNLLKQREQELRPATPRRESLKKRVQRVFSFTSRRSQRRDTDSSGSIGSANSHKPSEDAYEADSSVATSVAGDDVPKESSPVHSEEPISPPAVSPFRRIHRKFSLLSRRHSARVSSASSTLSDEFPFPGGLGNIGAGDAPRDGPREEAAEAAARPSRPSQPFGAGTSQVAGDALISVTSVEADFDAGDARARMAPVTRPRITSTPSLVSNPKLRSGHSQRGILRPLMESPMDSPALAPFEDAQEFSFSVVDAEPLVVPKPDPPHSISQTASPAPEDYTTAPSTPGLSTGGDPSPRNSLLITPTYTRTLSGMRDCVFDAGTETNTTPMEVLTTDVGAMPAYQAPKDVPETTPLARLAHAPEFVPATTPTPEPIEVSPPTTVAPKHTSKLSMSSLRASAPTFAPSFTPASLRAAAPTFVPGQGFVPVAEPAAPPKPAPQPTPAPTWAKVAAPAAPTWAKIAATKPKKAEVKPVAAKAPKEANSVDSKKTPEPKLSVPQAEKEQDKVDAAQEAETEGSVTPTAGEEPQGEKADEERPQTVVKEEDGAEAELEEPAIESADADASAPAVSVQEEKLPEIEEDLVEEDGVADELPVKEEEAAVVDIAEEAEVQEDKKEEVVEGSVEEGDEAAEQNGVEQDDLPGQSEELEQAVAEDAAEKPQATEQISGLTHIFVWASTSEDKIEESSAEQDDVEQESLPEEREESSPISVEGPEENVEETHIEEHGVQQESLPEEHDDSDHIVAEEAAARPEQPAEKISGLTHVFVWASPSGDKPVEEEVSGLKHVFVWAGSDAQQVPESQTLIAAAESAEEEPILSEDDALDNTHTEVEQQPECAAPEDKEAEVETAVADVKPVEEVDTKVRKEQVEEQGSSEHIEHQAKVEPEVSAGPEDAAAAIPEVNSEQHGEDSEEKVDTTTSDREIVEDQSAVQPETKTQVADAPAVEAQADEKSEVVKDTNLDEGIQADSGSDLENLEPDISEDDSTQAPVISVQDFAPSTPSDDVSPLKDTPAPPPTSNDNLTPTVTQLDTFSPTFLAPSLSARSSVSSFAEWSTYERTMADLSRGSVDTVRVSSDLPSEPESCHSRPQTAGYLGLGHGGADMGLRGALGDSRRRLSLPLKNILVAAASAGQKHELDAKSQETTAVGTPESSVAGDDAGTPSKPKKRRLEDEVVPKDDGEVKFQEKEDAGLILASEARPSVLPRMMMLLAGVVAVGKALKKPSVY